ncbi:MAG: DNA-3-methyladenine glycosylase I [Pikeienuella sp.]
MDETGRCPWCGSDPLYVAYHDQEWGVPEWDSRALYEKLMLDGFQAGLSWYTILKKRPAFQAAFAGFDPELVARFDENDVSRLLGDAGIVRHRGKIEAAINAARIWIEIEGEGGFDKFLWDFVDGAPLQNQFVWMADVPAETPLSKEVSKALKARGFKYCGPTIVYAFMEAVGMVNDHLVGCPRHAEVAAMAQRG